MNALWDSKLDQENAIELLDNIIKSNRIPHAFLFVGKEGVGKHHVAIQFAKKLNSDDSANFNSIQKKISNLSEPYIKYIISLPRGKSESKDDSATSSLSKDVIETVTDEIGKKINNPYYKISIPKASSIKINSIREVKKFININYDEIKYRIILIGDAHLMTEEAQNALLKSLEEPPNGVIFILTTPYENRLLPTIKSRCWTINFSPLTDLSLVYILKKYHQIDKNIAEKVAYFSDGSVTEAIRLCEEDFEELVEKVIDILRFSLARKFYSAIKTMNEVLQDQPGDKIKLVIMLISRWFSDAQKNRLGLKEYYFENSKETFEKFNKRFGDTEINGLLVKLDELSESVGRNVGLNMIATSIIFEISTIVMR
ncbi:ATP-binding protein [Bacteroidota bacterium]